MAKQFKPHDMRGRVINYYYCVCCGLIALRNNITLIAIGKSCKGS